MRSPLRQDERNEESGTDQEDMPRPRGTGGCHGEPFSGEYVAVLMGSMYHPRVESARN